MQVKKRGAEETVYPASPSPGGVLELNVLDQIQPRVLVPLLLFFKGGPHPQLQEPSVLLKDSLAQVLALFYPCAGRLRETSCNGDLEVVCSDEGASFHEIWVDSKLADFLPHPDFSLLVPAADPHLHPTSQIPPFVTQVTHFECGCMCLGIRMHHSICDGIAVAHFLSSWATLTKSIGNHAEGDMAKVGGEYLQYFHLKASGEADLKLDSEILRPHMDRTFLKANQRSYPPLDLPEFQSQEVINLTPNNIPATTRKIFSFTPECIEALKAKASPGHTRFEVLAAHMWRGVIEARGLDAEQDIKLSIAVDGRRRLKPFVEEGYFGNLVVNSHAITKAGRVVESPLGALADFVKATVGKVSDCLIRSVLDSPKSSVSSFFRPSSDVHISNWWGLPLYDLDFGWGKPCLVGTFRVPSGLLIFLPSPLGAGHVDALLGLDAEHMPLFEDYLNHHA